MAAVCFATACLSSEGKASSRLTKSVIALHIRWVLATILCRLWLLKPSVSFVLDIVSVAGASVVVPWYVCFSIAAVTPWHMFSCLSPACRNSPSCAGLVCG